MFVVRVRGADFEKGEDTRYGPRDIEGMFAQFE